MSSLRWLCRPDNSMAAILWAMGLSLLLQGCLCSVGQNDKGCMRWTPKGEDVCCDECHPGHRLYKDCGPRPTELCIPCEPGTYTESSKSYMCKRCTQCVGAQVYVKQCTTTSDTKCGCREGLICGDVPCSFCIKKCDKGEEPAAKRSCRPCPDGTFNDQIHQKCKPWSTKCPNTEQKIMARGDALNDIKCANVSIGTVSNPKKPDPTENALPLVLTVIISIVLMAFGIIITIIIMAKKIFQKSEEEGEKPIQIIRTPTDDPTTLIAIECSFHEAQQEQGSSLESLASKDSSEPLIA